MWGFFEIAGMDAYVELANYQWETYGTKLDEPLFLWKPGVERPIGYPTLSEIEREMKRKPKGMVRVV